MDIKLLLRRSDELEATIMRMLDLDQYPEYGDGTERMGLCVTAASLSIDHARALRSLTEDGFLSSAVPLMPLQFESTTRSAWLIFAASEAQVSLAAAPLTIDADEAARKLPVVREMIKQLRGASAVVPAAGAPAAMLDRFEDMQRRALNSFVHVGVHALRRHQDGFPLKLVYQLIECSNGLVTIAAMLLAMLTGDRVLAARMNRVHVGFKDCLTPLLPSY